MHFIARCVDWLTKTFKGAEVAPGQRDVPGLIARWLFRIGTIWAVLLVKIAAVLFIVTPVLLIGRFIFRDESSANINTSDILLPLFTLAGFAIWIGWGWRSRKRKKLKPCVLFWLASASFHATAPIHFFLEADGVWSVMNPLVLWHVSVAIASLVALCFEFFSPKVGNNLIDS